MFERLGFTAAAATELVDIRGIDDPDEIKHLTSDQVDKLISVVRKPGGGQNGNTVSFVAQGLFHNLVDYLQHMRRTSRLINVGTIDKATVCALCHQQEMEDSWPGPTVDDVKVNFKNMPKTMEQVIDVIRKRRGMTGACLDYVIRTALRPQASASDPSTNYISIDDEVVARHPIVTAHAPADDDEAEENGHFDESFLVDSQTVFDVLQSIFGSTKAWTYSKDYCKHKQVRKLFKKLTSHYLGENMIDHMASQM